jgi:hypothetical protein
MLKSTTVVLTVVALWFLGGSPTWAQTYGEQAEVVKALKDAKVTLQEGLTASQAQGTPISGKFEIEDGKLQLSVYTMKGDKFSEVIVDHTTGRSPRARQSRRVRT